MEIYVAIWNDRHCETTVHLFSSENKAVKWAKKTVREWDTYRDLDEELTEAMQKGPNPWVYYGQYSCEGCNIVVTKCVVDKDSK